MFNHTKEKKDLIELKLMHLRVLRIIALAYRWADDSTEEELSGYYNYFFDCICEYNKKIDLYSTNLQKA